MSQERWVLIQCLIISLLIAVLLLTVPVFMLQLYDRVLPSGNLHTLWIMVAISLLLLGILAVLDSLRNSLLVRTGSLIELRLLARYDDISCHTRLFEQLRACLTSPALAAIFDLPALPVFLIFLFFLHPYLAATAMVFALILAMVSFAGSLIGRKDQESNILNVPQFSQEQKLLSLAPSMLQKRVVQQRFNWRQSRVAQLISFGHLRSANKSIRLAAQIAIMAVGGWLAIHQSLSPAAIVAGTILLSRALAPVEQLLGSWPLLWNGLKAYRILKRDAGNADLLNQADGTFHFDDAERPDQKQMSLKVSQAAIFAPEANVPILRGIDFRLAGGNCLGVIGGSASGKTPLLKALAGAWPLKFGRLDFEGVDLASLSGPDKAGIVGFLESEPRLFAGTIAENIASFRNDADALAIVNAAKAAHVHQRIAQEPDGYGSLLAGNGDNISSQMKKFIALAAILYDSPPLILLDTPFSGLDTQSEAHMTDIINRLKDNGHVIVISATRLNELGCASHLAVLGEGRIQAAGPKSEVVEWLHQKMKPAHSFRGKNKRIASNDAALRDVRQVS